MEEERSGHTFSSNDTLDGKVSALQRQSQCTASTVQRIVGRKRHSADLIIKDNISAHYRQDTMGEKAGARQKILPFQARRKMSVLAESEGSAFIAAQYEGAASELFHLHDTVHRHSEIPERIHGKNAVVAGSLISDGIINADVALSVLKGRQDITGRIGKTLEHHHLQLETVIDFHFLSAQKFSFRRLPFSHLPLAVQAIIALHLVACGKEKNGKNGNYYYAKAMPCFHIGCILFLLNAKNHHCVLLSQPEKRTVSIAPLDEPRRVPSLWPYAVVKESPLPQRGEYVASRSR